MNHVISRFCCTCSLALLPLLAACHDTQDHRYYHGHHGSASHVKVENYGMRRHHTVRQVPPPPPPRGTVHHGHAAPRGSVQHGHAANRETIVVNPDPRRAHVEIDKNQYGHAG